MEHFEITAYRWGSSKAFKIRVYIIHQSDQVMRFRLCAGTKTMEIEKRLLKKKNQWKVIGANFRFSNDQQANDLTLQGIAYQIEIRLKGPQPPRIHPKNSTSNF